jgi:hypothetical protein
MGRTKKNIEELEKTENLKDSNVSTNIEENEPLQAEKLNKNLEKLLIKDTDLNIPDTQEPEILPKPKLKREQTEAQKLNTIKMREKLKEKQYRDKIEKEIRAEMEKKKLEEKIIKKAISIKKRQIKKERVLDNIEDDETPIEEIKKYYCPKDDNYYKPLIKYTFV